MIPFGDGPAPIYREEVGKKVYLNIIHGAREYLYITTPYLVCDRELLDALRLAARKGVDVRLIVPHIPDKKLVFLMTRSNYAALVAGGDKNLRVHARLHPRQKLYLRRPLRRLRDN